MNEGCCHCNLQDKAKKNKKDSIHNLEYLTIEQQLVNICTKPVESPTFLQLQLMLGVKEVVLGGHVKSSYLHFCLCCFLSFREELFPIGFSHL